MKINEVKLLPKQGNHNPFDPLVLTDLKPYKNANVEGHELLFSKHGNELFFVVCCGNERVAFAKAVQIEVPINALVIKRTFVIPHMRNKGYMTALYRTLRGNGNVIISDTDLSPESISIWKKLISHFNVHVIDAETGKIKRRARYSDVDTADDQSERLMLERYMQFGVPVQECGLGITKETEIFLGTDCP